MRMKHLIICFLAFTGCAVDSGTDLHAEAARSSDLSERIAVLRTDGWSVPEVANATVEDTAIVLPIQKRDITADLVFVHGDDGTPMVVLRPTGHAPQVAADALMATARSQLAGPVHDLLHGAPTPYTTGMWSCEYPRYRGWAGVCQSDWNYFGEYQYYQYEYGWGDALEVTAGGCGWACPDVLQEASLWLVCGEWGNC
jgi:hypothetical protein